MFNYETLFKKILIEKGLSYNMVARMTDIGPSSISNYANGYRVPDLYTSLRIVKVLQLPADVLYNLFKPTN